MGSQLNELRKGDKASNSQNRYNLRSKKKVGAPDVLENHTIAENLVKDMADNNKGKKIQTPSPVFQTPVPEVK
jgi:hypothetical protein